jgi:hypothetical protein
MTDRLAAEGVTDENSRALAGRDLFALLRDTTELTIRKGFSEGFFPRGMRHQIANQGTIGWHPDFEGRVRQLLGTTGIA